jgi:NAD-dependent DNA ligase
MNFDVEAINTDPQGFIKKNKKKDIIALLIAADEAFFNGTESLLKDDIYDIIKDYIRKKYPKDPYLKRVGADVDNKVLLPYYMGSQNKIKDSEEEITKYKKQFKGPYIISDKLDGVSCLIVYKRKEGVAGIKNNFDIKLYTRGNGTYGQDISHLLTYINGFPELSNIVGDYLAIRGELIISKDNWEKLRAQGENGANPRNTVSGAINSKTLNKKVLNAIDFVCYTLISPVDPKIKNGLEVIKKMKFLVVNHIIVNDINLDILSENLQKSRNNDYIIDGIVIADIGKHYDIEKDKNPTHSFAFKSIHTLEQVEVIVKEVEWNVSKDKYMKPIVKFDEIILDDVKIKQATGFNAGFIEKNVIGPGSRIIIIRSGNVIPHINSVLSKAANGKPSMPGTEGVNYKWNDTHVDIIMIDDGNKNSQYDIKNIIYFMKTIEIDYMGPGNIEKIYNGGYDTINKIINIKKEELLKIDGFKDKSAENIIGALKKIKDVDCNVLMDASNIMGRGFGSKKIKSITDVHPEIIDNTKTGRNKALKLKVEELTKINGIAKISAELFIENLPKYYEFYDSLGFKCNKGALAMAAAANAAPENIKINININLKDKTFIFSGFRNKEYEKAIVDNGGKVTTAISKNTSYLVVKDKTDNTAKIIKARELGIKILNIEDFAALMGEPAGETAGETAGGNRPQRGFYEGNRKGY